MSCTVDDQDFILIQFIEVFLLQYSVASIGGLTRDVLETAEIISWASTYKSHA